MLPPSVVMIPYVLSGVMTMEEAEKVRVLLLGDEIPATTWGLDAQIRLLLEGVRRG